MAYARLDDGFWMHPKIIMAGNTAVGIFARLLSYSGRYLTEGLIPRDIVNMIAGQDRAAVQELADLGLVLLEDGGCRIVDDGAVDSVLCRETAAMRRYRRWRRARGFATREQVEARVRFYGGLCWMCRTAPYEAIDHVKPLSAGGSNWPANLRPACKPCNSSKSAAWPWEPAR